MHDSSDDQHSVGLVQAGLTAVYKAEVRNTEPRSFQEALCHPNAALWFKAASEEIDAHHSNSTWESVQLSARCHAIGCHWVFKVKQNADSFVEHYKAHLVAKGYSQCPGVDFDETFAPTANWAALRAILAICALKDWEADSVDIVVCRLMAGGQHSGTSWRAQCMSRLKSLSHCASSRAL
jgi:hypothetical protein